MNVYTELNRNPLNSCRDISTKDKNVNLTVVLHDNFQPRRIEDAWKHNKQHHMNVCTKNFIHLYFSQVAGATDPQTDRLCRPSSHAAGTAEKINTLSFAYELGFPPNVFFFFFLNHLTYKDTVNKKGWRVWNFIINSKCFLWKFPCFIHSFTWSTFPSPIIHPYVFGQGSLFALFWSCSIPLYPNAPSVFAKSFNLSRFPSSSFPPPLPFCCYPSLW